MQPCWSRSQLIAVSDHLFIIVSDSLQRTPLQILHEKTTGNSVSMELGQQGKAKDAVPFVVKAIVDGKVGTQYTTLSLYKNISCFYFSRIFE